MSHDSNSILAGSHPDASEALQQLGSEVLPEGAAMPRVRRAPAFVEQFAAIVRASPCASNATADYADARYYLDRAVPKGSKSSTGVLSADVDQLPGVAQCLTATNLAELPAGSHLLPKGTIVQVFAVYPRSGVKQYVFNQPPPDGAVVMITAAASGGGKYTGSILSGPSSAIATGNLAMPEGMGTAPGSALVLNEEEDGQSGHRLSIPCYAVGQIAGVSNGQSVVMIRGALGATAGGATLGTGGGGAVAPDSTAWSRAGNAAPVTAWVQTRTVWDATGGVLYAYLRAMTFDARGVLVSISGENQVIVDVPIACQ